MSFEFKSLRAVGGGKYPQQRNEGNGIGLGTVADIFLVGGVRSRVRFRLRFRILRGATHTYFAQCRII